MLLATTTGLTYLNGRLNGEVVTFVLNQGDLLIARGDWFHFGAAYDGYGGLSSNLRIHWYFDKLQDEHGNCYNLREKNVTYVRQS